MSRRPIDEFRFWYGRTGTSKLDMVWRAAVLDLLEEIRDRIGPAPSPTPSEPHNQQPTPEATP